MWVLSEAAKRTNFACLLVCFLMCGVFALSFSLSVDYRVILPIRMQTCRIITLSLPFNVFLLGFYLLCFSLVMQAFLPLFWGVRDFFVILLVKNTVFLCVRSST